MLEVETMSNNESLGIIKQLDGQYVATLEREIEHKVENVWSMLVDSSHLLEWLAPGTIELRVGGSAKLDFVDSGIIIDSKVSAFEEEKILEYSWSGPGEPERPVRWELQSEGGATRLTLRLTCPINEDIARSCAGWEAHLMMLLAAIEGVPIKFPFERFQETRDVYKDMILE